jgi:hypothetical protein
MATGVLSTATGVPRICRVSGSVIDTALYRCRDYPLSDRTFGALYLRRFVQLPGWR